MPIRGTSRSRMAPRATPGPACEILPRARTCRRCGRAIARKNLQAMKKGDRAFFYHTGDEKQVVGIVEIIREAYKDPTDEKGGFYAVDTRALEPLKTPVALGAIKAEPKLKSMALAREPRLSVQPVTDEEWKLVCTMGGVKGEPPSP